MRLLPRRAAADIPATPANLDHLDNDPGESRGVPKGRPTPKRRDSEPRRGPVAPAPKTRREAMARQRQQSKTAKVNRTPESAKERRERMMSGDPAYLLRKDAGPLRLLARNYVDSRRMLSNGLLFLLPVLLLGGVIRAAAFIVDGLLVIFIVVAVGEWFLTGRKLLTMAQSRGIDTGRASPMGIGFYAGNRAFMPRKWRAPRPQVSLGESI